MFRNAVGPEPLSADQEQRCGDCPPRGSSNRETRPRVDWDGGLLGIGDDHVAMGGLGPVSTPLEQYALIGDLETAALVDGDGSIDWLCWPRFDSDACFAALLGTPENGRWRIAPKAEKFHAGRKYRPGTLILETRFETDDGAVTLVDLMPLRNNTSDIVRIVVGVRGRV